MSFQHYTFQIGGESFYTDLLFVTVWYFTVMYIAQQYEMKKEQINPSVPISMVLSTA